MTYLVWLTCSANFVKSTNCSDVAQKVRLTVELWALVSVTCGILFHIFHRKVFFPIVWINWWVLMLLIKRHYKKCQTLPDNMLHCIHFKPKLSACMMMMMCAYCCCNYTSDRVFASEECYFFWVKYYRKKYTIMQCLLFSFFWHDKPLPNIYKKQKLLPPNIQILTLL